MVKFRVMEITTVVREFEVEADNQEEAEQKAYELDIKDAIRTKVVECDYEVELIEESNNGN